MRREDGRARAVVLLSATATLIEAGEEQRATVVPDASSAVRSAREPWVLLAVPNVVLVQAEGGTTNLLIDPGPRMGGRLREIRLAQCGARRLDAVVNTHLHHDHADANDAFAAPRLYLTAAERERIITEWTRERFEFLASGKEVVAFSGERYELCEGVTLVATPGHTSGSLCVLVESERRTLVAGDTVVSDPGPGGFARPPRELAEAWRIVRELAPEWIIPGHGAPFAPSWS